MNKIVEMAAKLLTQMMMLVMLLLIKQACAENINRSAALPGCQESCGTLKISYPFGIGAKCSAAKAMEISCDNSFNPPKAFLRDEEFHNLEVLNISLEAGTIHINYPITTDCTNTRNDLVSHNVHLALPLTFSNSENRFTGMGCNSLALLSSGPEKSSQLEKGGCLSRCNPSLKKDNSCFGINCCQTEFPQSMVIIRPSLSKVNTSSSSCSEGPRYAFIVDQRWFTKLEDIYGVQTMEAVPAVLKWKPFGDCQTFIERDPVKNHTVCGVNALCTNQSLCSCKEGYEGNPYLLDGCQDINECAGSEADHWVKQPKRTSGKKLYEYHFKHSLGSPKPLGPALPGSSPGMKRCDHHCTNTPGSYTCSCKDGWLLVENFKCVAKSPVSSDTKVDDRRGKKGKKGKKAAMIGATATCAGVAVTFVTVWLYEVARQRNIIRLRRKFFKLNGGRWIRQPSSRQENAFTAKLFTSKELDKATDHYNLDRIVGQGREQGNLIVGQGREQGTVYRGMLSDGRMVAVKKTKIEDKSDGRKVEEKKTKIEDKSKLKHFLNEVVILSQINHRNIVKLYGYCLETEVPLLVYEFIPNGTLKQYIHKDDEYFPLTWDVRLRVATEIAGALYHLHSVASFPICHRDIKSTNILFDNKYRAKVADFGISRSFSIDQTHGTTGELGTLCYMDPEYIKSGQFTDKSDVYSFGVVLVELLKPTLDAKLDDEARSLATFFLSAMEEDRLLDIIDLPDINEREEEEMIAFADIARRCLNIDGKERPTMKEVVKQLKEIRNTPTDEQNFEEEIQDVIQELNFDEEPDDTCCSTDCFTDCFSDCC